MTQEEKLEEAKRLYETANADQKYVLERLFPELKESEDERIIERIKKAVESYWSDEPLDEIFAWLEKQGEQKPTDKVEPQKELAETYLTVFDKKFPILPTLRGKQLADYKNFLNECQQIFGLKYWGIRPLQAKLFEKLSLLWAAWGAEHLKGLGQTDGDTDNEKQEWSEEDELHIRELERLVKQVWATAENKNDKDTIHKMSDLLFFLKTLKPQNQWNPSDEQMLAINTAINVVGKGTINGKYLVELHEQLLKLREK